MVKKKSKRGRKKRMPMNTPGYRYWQCYKPDKRNLYQLQEVVNTGGGVKELSSWMTLGEARTFVSGWKRSGSRKKLPIFKRRR